MIHVLAGFLMYGGAAAIGAPGDPVAIPTTLNPNVAAIYRPSANDGITDPAHTFAELAWDPINAEFRPMRTVVGTPGGDAQKPLPRNGLDPRITDPAQANSLAVE